MDGYWKFPYPYEWSRSFVRISQSSRNFPTACSAPLCLWCSHRSWAVLLLGRCLSCLVLARYTVSVVHHLLVVLPSSVRRSRCLTICVICHMLLPCPILALLRCTLSYCISLVVYIGVRFFVPRTARRTCLPAMSYFVPLVGLVCLCPNSRVIKPYLWFSELI